MRSPNYLLTNGTASFGQDQLKNITCIDATADGEGNLSGPFALYCRHHQPELPKDPRSDCPQDGSTVCLPKCCLSNEVFNVDEMRCIPANASTLYKPNVYKFELNPTDNGKNNSYNLSVDPERIVTNSEFYVKYMHVAFCPASYGFLPQTTHVILLNDGR